MRRRPACIRVRVCLPLLALFLSWTFPALAVQPGDVCATANQLMWSGGPESSGNYFNLICDGANWQPQILFSSTNASAGYGAAIALTTGSYNAALGYKAINSTTTGTGNSAFGAYALKANLSGGYNTAGGDGTLGANTTGGSNSGFGSGALAGNQTGSNNVAFGSNALRTPTAASYNTAYGASALQLDTSGQYNTAFGFDALHNVSTGSNNLGLGYNAGSSTLTTGSGNILIGTSSAVDTPASGTSNYLNIGNLLEGDVSLSHAVIDGTAPTVTSGSSDCGTSPAIAGDDSTGMVTVGTSTNGSVCTLTFHTAWTTAPNCLAQNQTSNNILRAVTTTTTLKLTGTLGASNKISYLCIGYQL